MNLYKLITILAITCVMFNLSSCTHQDGFKPVFDKKTGLQTEKSKEALLIVQDTRYGGFVQSTDISISKDNELLNVSHGDKRILIIDAVITNKSQNSDFFYCYLKGANSLTIDPTLPSNNIGPNTIDNNPVEVGLKKAVSLK